MDFHIVSGFLGSGKTTAIITACKSLMARGKRVGVVTNDQGKYLVDTAFFELAAVPTVEVTGGCFCCNFDDLDARLSQLKHTARPDVIFAESVGSCADIVATVVKPLLELRADSFAPTSFSVFVDARMLRRRLLDLPMPFSDDVVYIFDKQIEEAGILVINKQDLLTVEDTQHIWTLARQSYPGKRIRLQNSLDPQSVNAWLNFLSDPLSTLPETSLDIDYQRYSAGEKQLAWLDETVTLHTSEGSGRMAVAVFLSTLAGAIAQRAIPVGHVKVLIQGQKEDVKLSLVAIEVQDWQVDLPPLSGTVITILVNARVEGDLESLRDVVHNAVTHTQEITGSQVEESLISTFYPGYPKPTHRIGNR
jgi:G3E family GTPase